MHMWHGRRYDCWDQEADPIAPSEHMPAGLMKLPKRYVFTTGNTSVCKTVADTQHCSFYPDIASRGKP